MKTYKKSTTAIVNPKQPTIKKVKVEQEVIIPKNGGLINLAWIVGTLFGSYYLIDYFI